MELRFMRYELLKKHTELVKKGKYLVARKILRFLIKKEISLGLNDTDWETEMILKDIGFNLWISPNGNTSIANYRAV